MPNKKRIVIFTAAGRAGREMEVFLQRLEENPKIEVVGIFVDLYSKPVNRLRFLMKRWGVAVFAASVLLKLAESLSWRQLWQSWHDMFVPAKNRVTFEKLAEAGYPIAYVDNINSKLASQQVIETEPDLGVILGGRILKDRITTVPKLGTLNIHKHDATKYRGSPQYGLPERRAGESEYVVTIHFATSEVDQGDIVGTGRFPIEQFDDDRSISVKATVFGMNAYVDAVNSVVSGDYTRSGQTPSSGRTYVTTPFTERVAFWRPYRQLLNRSQVCPRTSFLKRLMQSCCRVGRFVCCMASLPWLARKRRLSEQNGTAPIVIFYYHAVGNGGENWMTLPMHRLHEDIAYLLEHYEVISLDEALKRLRSGKNDRAAAVLTFDDGYKSCFHNLVPYLNYFRVPGTIFCCPKASSDGGIHQHDAEVGFHCATLMTESELRAASSDYVTIGSHGNYHENMGSLESEPLATAVVESGRELSRIIEQPVRYFSFPFGKKHHMSVEALQMGTLTYDAMFSAYGGYNFPDQANPFHFQRIANPASLSSMIAIMSGMHRLRPFIVDRPAKYNVASATSERPRAAA